MNRDQITNRREFLTNATWKHLDFTQSDQKTGAPMPPVQKAPKEGQQVIALPKFDPDRFQNTNIATLFQSRETRRRYTDQPLTSQELSFLLWATQGVRRDTGKVVFRTVPSGGNRHPLETYLAIQRVTGFEPGIYRYLPLDHALVLEQAFETQEALRDRLLDAFSNMPFFAEAAVGFIWTAIPYRGEWRYQDSAAKMVAIDAGHVCQNLYLAAEAIDCGTCAVGAYDQERIDELVGVDGVDEFALYMAPVGKVE